MMGTLGRALSTSLPSLASRVKERPLSIAFPCGLPRAWWRRAYASLAAAALVGCGTVPLTPPPEEAPLFRRIDARVGTVYTTAARTAVVTNPLLRIEIGKASVTRFEQAFAAMFAQTAELPDWPPWREGVTGVDGVIEVERVDAALVLGNDASRPDVVSVAFRVCLYETNGTEIRCWSPSARHTHQRGVGECLDLRPCIVPQTEIAVREAVARFLVEAENDPTLRAWAARSGRRGAAR